MTRHHAPLAQLAEQQTLNLRVRGSSPWRRTHSDLGLYPFRVPSCRPFRGHVCSTFARQSGPSRTTRPGHPEAPTDGFTQRDIDRSAAPGSAPAPPGTREAHRRYTGGPSGPRHPGYRTGQLRTVLLPALRSGRRVRLSMRAIGPGDRMSAAGFPAGGTPGSGSAGIPATAPWGLHAGVRLHGVDDGRGHRRRRVLASLIALVGFRWIRSSSSSRGIRVCRPFGRCRSPVTTGWGRGWCR